MDREVATAKIEETNMQCADIVDWSKNCFPLGVKIEGQDSPWLELNREDLKTLELMLSRRYLVMESTGNVTSLPPAASESTALSQLAGWCKAARTWLEGRKP